MPAITLRRPSSSALGPWSVWFSGLQTGTELWHWPSWFCSLQIDGGIWSHEPISIINLLPYISLQPIGSLSGKQTIAFVLLTTSNSADGFPCLASTQFTGNWVSRYVQNPTSLFGRKYFSNVPLKHCKVFKGVVPKISGAYCFWLKICLTFWIRQILYLDMNRGLTLSLPLLKLTPIVVKNYSLLNYDRAYVETELP